LAHKIALKTPNFQ